MGIKSSQIIVAADFENRAACESFASQVQGQVQCLKIGPVLFMNEGPALVQSLTEKGFEVFLDMKFHDIPNTVQKALEKTCNEMKLSFVTVHASGGRAMIQAAKSAIKQSRFNTKLLAVTVLTSLTESDLRDMNVSKTVEDHSKSLAVMAVSSGADGIVCSPHEIRSVRSVVPKETMLIVPGIRGDPKPGEERDDQRRTATAKEAFLWGANFIVVGRPITQAANPSEAFQRLLGEA